VHLIIPLDSPRIGPAHGRRPDPIEQEPFETSFASGRGPHDRLTYVRGLFRLARRHNNGVIIGEADPGSLLAAQLVILAKAKRSRVWLITVENRERSFVGEALAFLRRGRIGHFCGALSAVVLRAISVSNVDVVLTICRDGTSVMQALGFRNVRQIPLGFDPGLFYRKPDTLRQEIRESIGLTQPTIAYFGRLAPEKGLDVLLAALAQLTDLKWQFLLDSEGRAAYEQHIRAEIHRLGLDGRTVTFTATHTQIPDYMNAADIVVLPSISFGTFKEQYGRVLPEAMACGAIPVGTDCGAIPELIGDCGYLAPQGSPAELATALRRALTLNDADRTAAQLIAQRQAQSLSVTAQANIYQSILAEFARAQQP
jgi:glycosyltransferase involved in cell wall biosynthesis